jgi:hypothetical protein
MNEFFFYFFLDLLKSIDGETREYGLVCDWSGVEDFLVVFGDPDSEVGLFLNEIMSFLVIWDIHGKKTASDNF